MSRFTRICIIVALILILLGTGFAAVGATMGGFSLLRKSGGQGIFYTLNHAISFGEGYLDMDENKSFPMLTGKYSNDKLAKPGEVSELYVNIGGGQLVVKQSDDEYFKVESNTKLKFQCYVQDGRINLKGFKGRLWGDYSHNSITLYIPKDVSLETIDVDLGAGAVTADRLSAGDVTFEVGAGSLNVDNLDAHKVDVDLGAGKVVIGGSTMDADIEIGMGALEWKGSIAKDMDLSCSMGSVELGLKGGDEKSHNYSISCSGGSVTVGGSSYAEGVNDMNIDNGAPGTYDIDCSMGSVRIYFIQ